jgi:AraC-like DNA-binding protein
LKQEEKMPIHFRNSPVNEPFIFDSIGNHWSQDRVLRPHGYPVYHYLQTESGSGTVRAQDREYVLHEGEGVLIAPYVPHSYTRNEEKWLTCFATFTGTLHASIDKMTGNRPVIPVDREQGQRIASQIGWMMDHWEELSADTCAQSVSCYQLLMNFTDGIRTGSLADEPLYQRYVVPAIKEIETSYDTELTAQMLSARVYVTPQYLARLFRRFLGCSPYEYLTTYRINRARELLISNPRLEVQQVARQTGFGDASHFIAMFKKTTGVTPLEFRRLN